MASGVEKEAAGREVQVRKKFTDVPGQTWLLSAMFHKGHTFPGSSVSQGEGGQGGTTRGGKVTDGQVRWCPGCLYDRGWLSQ